MVESRIYYDDNKKKWEVYSGENYKSFEESTGIKTINLHHRLRDKLDNVHKAIKKKWDVVFIIDGPERSGKSTLGMTCAWYLSKGKLTIDNFAAGMGDAADKIEKLPQNSILFVDEGSLVFNSKDAITREGKKLQKVLDVVGQKNITFIIVLPSFFDLNKNVAVRRSKFLLHVYSDKNMNRGKFSYFSSKRKAGLYNRNKKMPVPSYSKPKPNWRGNFGDFIPPFNEEYLALKRKSLDEALHGEESSSKNIWIGDIRAMFIQKVVKSLQAKHKIPKKDFVEAFGISHRIFVRDFEKELPEKLLNLSANRKIDVHSSGRDDIP